MGVKKELRLVKSTDPFGHKKTVSKSRNGGGATIRKNKLKIGQTDGEQDLPVSLRGCSKQPALHQLVFGLKHDAKLRNHFADQIPGNVKFLSGFFFDLFSIFIFCDWKEIAEIYGMYSAVNLFSTKFSACTAFNQNRNFGCLFRDKSSACVRTQKSP
ncbi:hypothetical protein [Hymenobacter arizonensis]|uniref:hypothetical protein n=1 Tax=Hymenobacter arizonensis TaxID=1227077 RepID=UPI001160525A|nr:hypothetical protein [Hymenobacter arizonensis]